MHARTSTRAHSHSHTPHTHTHAANTICDIYKVTLPHAPTHTHTHTHLDKQNLRHLEGASAKGCFEWVDGMLVRALQQGVLVRRTKP